MKIISVWVTTILVAASLSACASADDFAGKLASRGTAATAIAEDYRDGLALIEKGEDNIRAGRALVDRGQDRVDEGERQVRQGEALKASAKQAYCEQVGYQAPECL